MEAGTGTSNLLRRKPLADCTNTPRTLASSSSTYSISSKFAEPEFTNTAKRLNKKTNDIRNPSDPSLVPISSTFRSLQNSLSASAVLAEKQCTTTKSNTRIRFVANRSFNLQNLNGSSASSSSTPHHLPSYFSRTAGLVKKTDTTPKSDNTAKSNLNSNNVLEKTITHSPPSSPACNPSISSSRISTVYRRRQTVEKETNGKTAAISTSSTITKRVRNNRGKLVGSSAIRQCKSCPARSKKQRHMQPKDDVSTHALPLDFIEQQRAYFAEVDAFELPVEVASDSE